MPAASQAVGRGSSRALPARWANQVRVPSALAALCGIWLIIAPFVVAYKPGDPRWNDVAFGVIVLLLESARATALYREWRPGMLTILIGAWLFCAGFSIDDGAATIANDVLVGSALFILGSISVSNTQRGLHDQTGWEDGAARRRTGWFRY